MRISRVVAIHLVVIMVGSFSPSAANAQGGVGRIRSEISGTWVESVDATTGEVSLMSPGYPYGAGCVINELKIQDRALDNNDFAELRFSRRVFVSVTEERCESIPIARYAQLGDYLSLFDVMRFLARVNRGDALVSSGGDVSQQRNLFDCIKGLAVGKAAVTRVGTALDFDDSNAYVADIWCGAMPAGYRIVARGTSWFDGEMVWKVLPPLPHPD